MSKRKTYSLEFKKEALATYMQEKEVSNKSMAQVEKDLGLAKGSLTRWKRQIGDIATTATDTAESAVTKATEIKEAIAAQTQEVKAKLDTAKAEFANAQATAEAKRDEAQTEESTEEPSANPSNRIESILAQLSKLAEDLRQRFPNFTPPTFSPEELLASLRANIDKLKPEVIKDIETRLVTATADDFRNTEIWRDIWDIISYALQKEAESLAGKVGETAGNLSTSVSQTAENLANSVNETADKIPGVKQSKEAFDKLPTIGETREKIESLPGIKQGKEFVDSLPATKQAQEFLSTLPGAKLVTGVTQKLETSAPKDFLNAATWNDIWSVVDHNLKEEWSDLKQRTGREEPPEEEISISDQ